MRKLEDAVVEAEETVEDLRDSNLAMEEYHQTGGRDIEEVFAEIDSSRDLPKKEASLGVLIENSPHFRQKYKSAYE